MGFETDVLVIGGGGAGFRAAIGAQEKEAKALLVSLGQQGRCDFSRLLLMYSLSRYSQKLIVM